MAECQCFAVHDFVNICFQHAALSGPDLLTHMQAVIRQSADAERAYYEKYGWPEDN
jgi:hypothetical protein